VSYGVDPAPRAYGSGGTLESSPGAGPSIDSMTASLGVANECTNRAATRHVLSAGALTVTRCDRGQIAAGAGGSVKRPCDPPATHHPLPSCLSSHARTSRALTRPGPTGQTIAAGGRKRPEYHAPRPSESNASRPPLSGAATVVRVGDPARGRRDPHHSRLVGLNHDAQLVERDRVDVGRRRLHAPCPDQRPLRRAEVTDARDHHRRMGFA
jgi:hypothetical protein